MADLKTQPSSFSVEDFLNSVADVQQRADSFALVDIMREETGEEPVMWGGSIIGFGHYHYVYESGREGDWFLTGFSPRKGKISVYLMNGFSKVEELLGQLGPHKTGKSCLYIKRLADIDESVLRQLIKLSVAKKI
ncbi:MAG: DUF1801 domain-containing protein [Saprospiraceae bacterium]